MDKPIELIPNTGHQYFFLEFPLGQDRDVLGRYAEASQEDGESPWVLDKDSEIWQRCIGDDSPWNQHEFPWIRWRYGRKDTGGLSKEPVCGIWVAVETNTGTNSRGTYHKREEKNEPNPNRQSERYDVPYASEDDRSLEDVYVKFEEDGTHLHGVKICWITRTTAEDIDVDIIVDFGNTRTVVLLLEKTRREAGEVVKLKGMVRPVRFMKAGQSYEHDELATNNYEDTILDSWFVLHETPFSKFEPPLQKDETKFMREPEIETRQKGFIKKKKFEILAAEILKVPQSFVQTAPMILSDEAQHVLSGVDFSQGGVAFMSSPKRYSWDNDPVKDYWLLRTNRWEHRSSDSMDLLRGYVFKFLPTEIEAEEDDELEWDLYSPPHERKDIARRPHVDPDPPNFARSDTITWMALAIIEAAYRQINSIEYRKSTAKTRVRRNLKGVHVTYPSGWTGHEINLYRRKWKTAVNVFTLAHVEQRSNGPKLYMETDEALASQLPIVYSEIHSLDNIAKNWLELIGRGEGREARARIMTIDIGGGTTDLAIVEYKNNHVDVPGAVDLKATLLFKDSSAVGGDILVKKIIEEVLLPSLGSDFVHDEVKRAQFEQVFRLKDQQKEKWKRVVRLVLIPKVIQWLSLLAKNNTDPEELNRNDDGTLVFDGASLRDLNDFAKGEGLQTWNLNEDTPIIYGIGDINKAIRVTFERLFNNYAKIIARFEVDMVVVTGKPSELPEVKKLLSECLPIMPNRIISAKDYPVGDWYPFERNGKIYDAKTVTAVGAALHRAILDGKIDKWKITFNLFDGMQTDNYSWVLLGKEQGDPILPQGRKYATMTLQINQRIGKTLLPGAQKPDPVYIFTWKNRTESKNWLQETIKVKIERVPPPKNPDQSLSYKAEKLRITEAEGVITDPVTGESIKLGPQHVTLKLNTLEEEEFWMDSPAFDVLWNSHDMNAAQKHSSKA